MAISDRLLFDIGISRIYPSNYCICTPISCSTVPSFCDGIHYQRIWYCASSCFFLSFRCFHDLLDLQDAQANGLVASLKHQAEAKMGILHAVYGEFPSWFI